MAIIGNIPYFQTIPFLGFSLSWGFDGVLNGAFDGDFMAIFETWPPFQAPLRQANNPELFKNQVLESLKTPLGELSNWSFSLDP